MVPSSFFAVAFTSGRIIFLRQWGAFDTLILGTLVSGKSMLA